MPRGHSADQKNCQGRISQSRSKCVRDNRFITPNHSKAFWVPYFKNLLICWNIKLSWLEVNAKIHRNILFAWIKIEMIPDRNKLFQLVSECQFMVHCDWAMVIRKLATQKFKVHSKSVEGFLLREHTANFVFLFDFLNWNIQNVELII